MARTQRSNDMVVSIGVAARLCGVHPQTLREYERQGLVTPLRTPGGARRYRERDIVRLKRILDLTEQGMSLAAVAYVLELEDEVAALRRRVRELEDVAGPGRSTRSMSLEIVHVPRPRRSRRWSNDEW